MSEYLLNKLFQKCDNIISTNLEDVNYSTEITLNCNIHGQYIKTVNQILYKNPNCPECTRIAKNKKLSDIGKTKTGEKNNFYGHKHSDETCAKIRNTLQINAEERNKKISETVKSKECQERTKQTCLEKYGVPSYVNSDKIKKSKKANIRKYIKENNVTHVVSLIKLYGNNWYNANIVKTFKYNGIRFVNNYDIDKIIHYYIQHNNRINKNAGMSYKEKEIVD